MLCFLKRVLPFTLTLLIGLAIGSFFNLWGSDAQVEQREFRLVTSTAGTGIGTGAGGSGGCRYRFRSSSEDSRPARILSQAEPGYTADARRNRTEGNVILRVTLAADGTVSNIETITSLPYGLTEQAWRAAREITFVPATRNGQAVDEVKTITYSFNLD